MSTPAVAAPSVGRGARVVRASTSDGLAGSAGNSAGGPSCLRLEVTTSAASEVVDLTEHLAPFVRQQGIRYGVLAVHTLHTTTAVVINEYEPLLHEDLFRQLERLAPCAGPYAHDDVARRVVNRQDAERTNGHAHCRALLLGNGVTLPIVDGRLLLGRWQRVLFVEFDGPQVRGVVATIAGGGDR